MRYLRYKWYSFFYNFFSKQGIKSNFYTDYVHIGDTSAKIIYNADYVVSLSKAGISFDKEHIKYFDKCNEVYLSEFKQIRRCYRHNNCSVLGHNGNIIDNNSSKVITVNNFATKVLWNQVKPKKLDTIFAEDNVHISMLGLRRGHKHFYHFFADYFIELWFYITHVPKYLILVQGLLCVMRGNILNASAVMLPLNLPRNATLWF